MIFDFGFAQGPYAVRDQSGLDIGYQARKAQGGSNERRFLLSDTLCDMGRRGQKTGAGFYKYEKGDRTPHVDPEVNALIDKLSADLGIKRRKISQDEIIERIIYPMINEGAKITEEGIALRASDVDVTYIHGYGYPRYRGGLMFYADTVGPKKVYEVMKKLEKEEIHRNYPMINTRATKYAVFHPHGGMLWASKAVAAIAGRPARGRDSIIAMKRRRFMLPIWTFREPSPITLPSWRLYGGGNPG